MENKNSIPPKLYRNMLADNYKQARNDYQKIREYYNKNNNPICQTDDRYIIPKTKGNILSQEYNKKMMEKPEKAHIKRIPIQCHHALIPINTKNRLHPISLHKTNRRNEFIHDDRNRRIFRRN